MSPSYMPSLQPRQATDTPFVSTLFAAWIRLDPLAAGGGKVSETQSPATFHHPGRKIKTHLVNRMPGVREFFKNIVAEP